MTEQTRNSADSAPAPEVQGHFGGTKPGSERGKSKGNGVARGNGHDDQTRGGPQEAGEGPDGQEQNQEAQDQDSVQGVPVGQHLGADADTGLEDGEDDSDDNFSDLVDNSVDWPLDPARYADADKAQGICFDGLVPFTIAENATERLTKTYAETADGLTFRKLKGPYTQNSGRFIQAWLPASQTMTAFNALLDTFTFRQALAPGVFAASAKMLKMRRKKVVLQQSDTSSDPAGRALYRGKDQLVYVAGQPGLLALDHDVGELHQAPKAAAALERLDGLLGVLTEIDPQWAGIGLVMRASCSTGIKDTRTGRTKPTGGWHLYAIGQDGADFGRYARTVFVRAALLGVIYVLVDPVGGLHVRGLIDLMASGVAEWLMFEAPAILEGDHLVRDLSLVPQPVVHEGGMLDTHTLPDLTADEERRFATLVVELKGEKEPEARALQLQARQVGIAKSVANGLTQAQAEAQALAAFDSRRLDLHTDYWFMQKLPDGNMHASGAAMLAHPDPMVFDGILGPDVLDPGYDDGRQVAKWWWCGLSGGGYRVSSFAHGGERDGKKIYSLSYEASDVIERVTTELIGLPAAAVIEGLRGIMRMYWPSDAEQGRLALRATGIPCLAVFDFDDDGDMSAGALQAALERQDWLRLAQMRGQMGVVFDAAVDELRDADEDLGLGIADHVPDGWDGLGTALDAVLEEPDAAAYTEDDDPSLAGIDADALGAVTWPPDDEVMNPWDKATPPAWPGGVFPDAIERALRETAERDQLDLGGFGSAYMTAASGAAHKGARLTPYAGSVWQVPPILWALLIGDSGQRKTALFNYVTRPIKQVHADHIKAYRVAMVQWKARTAAQKNMPPPPGEKGFLASDVSLEKLQEWIAHNPRGLFYARDELAPWFEFGRYTKGLGAAERAFYLEAHEGGSHSVGRMGRPTTLMENCALAILGFIQEDRLADFTGLDKDGLIQRFGIVLMQDAKATAAGGVAPDMTAAHAGLAGLLALGTFDSYCLDAAGEALIRVTEALGDTEGRRRTNGVGFRGFMNKLHGMHARVALVLHLLDGGQARVIPEDTVYRAGRYVHFLWEHARIFHAGLAGSAENTTKAIASYLLRHQPRRMSAGNLRQKIAVCRELRTLKDVQGAVELLVLGGWLLPERATPDNRAWLVRPELHKLLGPELLAEEQERVEAVKSAMNFQGRYR